MSVVTTELAPITLRSPTLTPLVTTTLAPHQTLSAIRVGPLVENPCQVIGASGSSKRWLASVTKQPLANMQWLPISTSSTAASITAMFRIVPSPIFTRADPGAVIQTFGSNSVPAPISSLPSSSASSTLPCSGQRAKALRRIISTWILARFQGSELRSYQRHFCAHSFSWAAVSFSGSSPGRPDGSRRSDPALHRSIWHSHHRRTRRPPTPTASGMRAAARPAGRR
jgi:hypothetical protein